MESDCPDCTPYTDGSRSRVINARELLKKLTEELKKHGVEPGDEALREALRQELGKRL